MFWQTINWGCPQDCVFSSEFNNMSGEDFKKKLSHWWDQEEIVHQTAKLAQTRCHHETEKSISDLSIVWFRSFLNGFFYCAWSSTFFRNCWFVIFCKFCENACFSFFTFNRILILIESNFDFPSFFRVNFFVHFESLKIHAEFSRGGESCAHISFVKNKDFFLSLIAHHFFAFIAKLES